MSQIRVLYNVGGRLEDLGKMNLSLRRKGLESIVSLKEVFSNRDMLAELNSDPNYNFVIVHVGHQPDGSTYRAADQAKSLVTASIEDAKVIAESTAAGYYREDIMLGRKFGREELLRHFDEIIWFDPSGKEWVELFKKHGYEIEDEK